MATAKLRKTFRYPSVDSDEDETPQALDEEEQEKLIQKLRVETEERNEEYMRMFLAIPVCSIVAYVPSLLMFSSLQAKFLSILSITSLVSTAYMLFFIPNVRLNTSRRKRRNLQIEPEPSMIDQYLGYLNGGLSFLIALNAWTIQEKNGVHDLFWTLCLLPSLVFVVIVVAKRLMISVDVDELEDLKYGYKGA
ncbi:hypothetical protein MMC14_006722 [Varicellaria rhodocarpa]|nr:hypothetical protein [Varicellaria rhodocarpa]